MKTDAVAAAVSEALRLVNRSRAEWPEEAVEHAARRGAELAREECAKEIIELGAKLHIDITKKLGRGAEGWGAACAYLAAAIRAGSGE